MSSGRSVGAIAASIVGLIALAVVIVLLADRQAPKQFAVGTPEATLQAYLTAWEADDLDVAYLHYSDAARQRISREQFEQAASQWRASRDGDLEELVLIDRSDIEGERATVYAIVESTYGTGLERNTFRREYDIGLRLEDGSWRLTDPLVWLEPVDNYLFN